MKDSPSMLLLPIGVIIGAVGFMFALSALSPVQEEVASVEEKIVETKTSTTSSSTIAIIRFNQGTSSAQDLTPEEREARWLEQEKKMWRRSYVILEEPCDFEEIENFADELLAKPEWAEVLKQYPNRTYTRHKEENLYIVSESRFLYTCFVEVKLDSGQISSAEFNRPYSEIIKTWEILPLLNDSEEYSSGYTEFYLEDVAFGTLLADGPVGSSYGTYQYSDDLRKVRLFGVSHSSRSEMSVYETEMDGEDICPCSKSLELRITNEISAQDIRTAIERGKLPDNFEEELKNEE